MDAGIAIVAMDETGDLASQLFSALAEQKWVAAGIAGVLLCLTLLKKFGVFTAKKPVEAPKVVEPDQDADKAADRVRALLSMKDPEDK